MRFVLAFCIVASVAPAGCSRSEAPASGPAAAATARPALPDSARQLLASLPADNDVPGWVRSREPRHYVPATLWDYIDGGADSYLKFDFQEVVALEYANKAAGLTIAVDVYRMASPLGAFGIYAQELNPASTPVALGGEASINRTALRMWTGSCYVKLTSGTDHPELAKALQAIAADAARRIGGTTDRPPQFERFPSAGLVARSFKVVPRDVLGQGYLAGGFEARYGAGRDAWTLTLIPFDTPANATAALTRYRDFLAANAKIARDRIAPGDGGFVARDSYYGVIVAARSGASMAVALGPPTEGEGVEAVARLLK